MNVYYDVEDNHYRTYPDGDIATVDQMRELIENKNVSIVKLQQENKILKENAENNDKVVDKVNWENMLLKKENQDLKKQLENKYEKVGTLTSELLYEENTKLINQQKEFINYLEKRYKDITSVIGSYGSNTDMLYGKKDILEEILKKYKSIIGVLDETNIK